MATLVPRTALFDTTTSRTEPVADFRPLGYDLADDDQPVFRYRRFGASVEDRIRAVDGKYLERELTIDNPPAGQALVCRLAVGKSIGQVNKNTYVVDDKRYFIRLPDGTKASIEQSGGVTVLSVPADKRVKYSILW
jgi:hypothetical protein